MKFFVLSACLALSSAYVAAPMNYVYTQPQSPPVMKIPEPGINLGNPTLYNAAHQMRGFQQQQMVHMVQQPQMVQIQQQPQPIQVAAYAAQPQIQLAQPGLVAPVQYSN